MPPPVFLLCLLLEPVLDFLKEVFAVALKLGLAYPRNFKEFAVVFWQAAAHIGEGSVLALRWSSILCAAAKTNAFSVLVLISSRPIISWQIPAKSASGI